MLKYDVSFSQEDLMNGTWKVVPSVTGKIIFPMAITIPSYNTAMGTGTSLKRFLVGYHKVDESFPVTTAGRWFFSPQNGINCNACQRGLSIANFVAENSEGFLETATSCELCVRCDEAVDNVSGILTLSIYYILV